MSLANFAHDPDDDQVKRALELAAAGRKQIQDEQIVETARINAIRAEQEEAWAAYRRLVADDLPLNVLPFLVDQPTWRENTDPPDGHHSHTTVAYTINVPGLFPISLVTGDLGKIKLYCVPPIGRENGRLAPVWDLDIYEPGIGYSHRQDYHNLEIAMARAQERWEEMRRLEGQLAANADISHQRESAPKPEPTYIPLDPNGAAQKTNSVLFFETVDDFNAYIDRRIDLHMAKK